MLKEDAPQPGLDTMVRVANGLRGVAGLVKWQPDCMLGKPGTTMKSEVRSCAVSRTASLLLLLILLNDLQSDTCRSGRCCTVGPEMQQTMCHRLYLTY